MSLSIYKEQVTARFSPGDLDELHENYELIADTIEPIPLGKFVMKAVLKATQLTKPKTEKVTDPALVKRNDELAEQVEALQAANNELEQINSGLQSTNAEMAKIREILKPYILLASRRYKWIKNESPTEMIAFMLEKMQQRNSLVMDEGDKAFLRGIEDVQ